MNKLHWRIRLDTWLGYMFNMIAGRRCSAFIKAWYDHKYPVVTPLDELPRWLPGFVYVTKWTKLDGIDLPIAVVDSPMHTAMTAMVVLDAMMVNEFGEYGFEYIIITQSLMDILTNEEVMGVLHHEMRHAKRQWLLMVGHKRIVNKMVEKSDHPARIIRLDKYFYSFISWIMEFDADRVPKQYRKHLASALIKITKESGEVIGRLTGACATHPPITMRTFLLRK